MILKLDDLLEDFKNFVHASIIHPREFQDFEYLGNIYRIKITFKRKKPSPIGLKYPIKHRTKRIPRTNIEVSKCVTCGGPAIGPVCMYKSCEIVIQAVNK